MPLIARLMTLALLLAVAPADASPLDPATIERQRAAYRAALPHAEAGNWARVQPQLAELQGYPLLPYLRAAWLRNQLGPGTDREVREFLERHADLGVSAGLRRQWAGSLARRGAWADYLALFEASYTDSGDAVLQCHAFTARIRLDRSAGLEAEVLQRWLSPTSVAKECDPAFEWLQQRGAITTEQRRKRMELALDAGEFGLARWLARPLGEAAVAEVTRWERLAGNPPAHLGSPAAWRDTPRERALVLFGFHRVAATDPEFAAYNWPGFRTHFGFSAEERGRIDRRIALVHAWRHLPGAQALLAALPDESHDDDTRAWTVRMAIRAQDWAAIEAALARLGPEAAQEPVWRYWQARVFETTGRSELARPIFAELAADRGYYSFMSADRLNADYNWTHASTAPDEAVLAALEQRPDILRARELFKTGQEPSGRTEWQLAIARLSADERPQAGHLAKRWGWYSRAITAASGTGIPDDLELRFPLPWRPLFEEKSQRAGISSAWAYGVARSESLFMPDVSSGAGAVGLMQLLPGTGRETAPRAGVTYRGQQTLLDPAANIALGTTYLAQMLARFDHQPILATAAYNAGPGRVLRWLPLEEAMPAEAWVDSIPFTETRGYVQRVLASEAVFYWRMSGETRRLAHAMQPVQPRNVRGLGATGVAAP